jgi:3-oxoacyl-[acyl-carrier protein] reductase
MTDVRGKVAIVTGGTGGIGAGVALELARAGANVVISGRDLAKADSVLRRIAAAAGGEGHFFAGDVRSQADMERLVAETVRRFGGVDIVVPSAGSNDDEARTSAVRGPFAGLDLRRVTDFVAESLLGKLLVVQAAIPHLRDGGGSVVFVTSEGGRAPTPGQTAISSFSGGLIMASKVLSKELAHDGIRVNCVCVTVVRDSPSWRAAFESDDGVSLQHRRQYEKILDRSPFGVATPADIGKVVGFLASEDAHYLTGAVTSPTGGLTIH